jgi:DNA repair protein RecN (Recombination protein N)
MLLHLRVSNLGVITDSSLKLGPGLTVITGETGTGKTLLLGGLRLILGERADLSLVGGEGDEARAEGLFEFDGEEVAVARVVPAEGRSRAYANGVLAPAAALAETVGQLVEIVGQHDQLALRRPSVVLDLVDSAAAETMAGVLADYETAWKSFQEAEAERASLGGDGMSLRRELDLVAFQAAEIEGARIEAGEDESLEAEVSRMRNAEEITFNLAETSHLLDLVSEEVGETVARLRKVADLDPESSHLAGDAQLIAEAVSELSKEVSRAGESVDHDPRRLGEMERRLTEFGDLKRKYGRTLEDVIAFGEWARSRAEEIDRMLGRADQVEQEVAETWRALEGAARRLTTARAESAHALVERAQGHLGDLGMSRARLEVRMSQIQPGPSGADRTDVWFSSDPKLDLAPIASGASGGELSRLVLAIRLAARREEGATLVFDEVDTGVGGATALALGRKLAELASSAQVLCVTHLPQVAAFATTHYVVSREGGSASVGAVEGEDRVKEITRMLAGLPDSEASSQAAAELLRIATGHDPGDPGR